MSFFNEIL